MITGALLTVFTVTVTVIGPVVRPPASVATYVNVSVPFRKLGFGV